MEGMMLKPIAAAALVALTLAVAAAQDDTPPSEILQAAVDGLQLFIGKIQN